ncbi:MAG TPA: hypothetical protein DIT05_17060 [Morganella sp. (in: Bacteria)]|nr:hypothetical protein [Morganella sp. (in: enterobacteria)]
MSQFTDIDRNNARVILANFYDPAYAGRVPMTDEAVTVIWEMLSEAEKCTNMMAYIPTPAGAMPGIGYIASQLGKMANRIRQAGNGKVDIKCRVQIKSIFRLKFDEIISGI